MNKPKEVKLLWVLIYNSLRIKFISFKKIPDLNQFLNINNLKEKK